MFLWATQVGVFKRIIIGSRHAELRTYTSSVMRMKVGFGICSWITLLWAATLVCGVLACYANGSNGQRGRGMEEDEKFNDSERECTKS